MKRSSSAANVIGDKEEWLDHKSLKSEFLKPQVRQNLSGYTIAPFVVTGHQVEVDGCIQATEHGTDCSGHDIQFIGYENRREEIEENGWSLSLLKSNPNNMP